MRNDTLLLFCYGKIFKVAWLMVLLMVLNALTQYFSLSSNFQVLNMKSEVFR